MQDYFHNFYDRLIQWINHTLWTYNKTSITTFTLFRFFILVYLTVWIARLILRTLDKRAEKGEIFQRPLIYRLARLTYYTTIVIGFLIALSSIGFDFSSFIWIASALGVGLGFGLQPIFNNFLSGVILLFESQLKIGDFIELEGGVKGEIQEINFRTTTLYTQDSIQILVPNSSLINARVAITWTPANPYRCVRIPFSLPVNAEKNRILSAIIEDAKNVSLTFEAKSPVAYSVKLSELYQEYELWVWVHEKEYTSPAKVYSEYLELVSRTIIENNGKVEA